MIRELIQDIIMVPMHAVEGAATRYRYAAHFYSMLAISYYITRKYFHFGENEFQKNVRPGKRILDIGCGPGFITGLLEKRFNTSIGIDLDSKMLKKARRFSKKAFFVRGDMAQLPFRQDSFETVVSLGAVHCVDYTRLVEEIYRILAPSGEVHILIDNTIIPLFVPRSSGRHLKSALMARGFRNICTSAVGRLYLYIKACK
jgi:ubiquinone/menaquinone biosynthesis C-methylase UbiE